MRVCLCVLWPFAPHFSLVPNIHRASLNLPLSHRLLLIPHVRTGRGLGPSGIVLIILLTCGGQALWLAISATSATERGGSGGIIIIIRGRRSVIGSSKE